MRGTLRIFVVLVVLIAVSLSVWIANYVFWFGSDAPQIDYHTEIREMQAAASGALPDDLRAHGVLLELGGIFDELGEDGLVEPYNLDFSKKLDGQSPETKAVVESWVLVCEDRGVFEKMDELGELPCYVTRWDTTRLFGTDYLAGSSSLRASIMASGYRGRLGLYEGDAQIALEEIERQIKIARLLLSQPVAINRLMGHAVLAESIRLCRDSLHEGVSETELGVLAELFDSVELFPIGLVIEGERLIAQNAVAGIFQNNRAIKVVSRGAQWFRIDSEFDRMQRWSEQPVFERARSPFVDAKDDWRYVPADILLPAMSAMVRSHDQITTDLNGIRLEIAIERYRQAVGSLPVTLDDLLPDYMDEIPGDIFADREPALRYRVLDVPDDKGRDYHLYSVGYDGTDNGGAEPEKKAHEALSPEYEGTDFMLHRFE